MLRVWILQVIGSSVMYVKHMIISRDRMNVDAYLAEQFKSK